MTQAQERALQIIRRCAEEQLFFGGKDKYEFKQWKVDENEYFVSVILEVGLIGDEGTMASIYARDRALLFVGKRGGIRYPCTNRKAKRTSRTSPNVIGAVCAQRI